MSDVKLYTNIRLTNTKPKTEFVSFLQSLECEEKGVYLLIDTERVKELKKIIKHLINGK